MDRKDNLAKNSIKQMKHALANVGIVLTEENWTSFNETCHSVVLGDPLIADVATNGKGVTKDYTLASAYGEFLERAQNGLLYPEKYGASESHINYYWDQQAHSWDDLLTNYPTLMESCLQSEQGSTRTFFDDRKSANARCVPFYNYNKSQIDFLPIDLIQSTCGSNGMSAGNSPSEAILQAVCEILERYVIRKIFFDTDLQIPLIPPADLIKHDSSGIVSRFIDQGFNVQGLDLTLGRFPVLGIILFNREKTKYRVAVGADPVLSIAIQRCLTEVVQGIQLNGVEHSMKDFDLSNPLEDPNYRLANYYRFHMDGAGAFPLEKLFNDQTPQHQRVFKTQIQDNQKQVTALLADLQKQGVEIFIRDVSFLGFPSYFVYMPGLSEKCLNPGRQKLIFDNFLDDFKDAPFKLAQLSDSALSRYTELLRMVRDTVLVKVVAISMVDLLDIKLPAEHELHDLTIDQFLCLLYFKQKKWSESLHFLKQCLKEQPQSDDNSYFQGVAAFLTQKIKGLPLNKIAHNLAQLFGNPLTKELLNDLQHPETIFKYYKFTGGTQGSGWHKSVSVYATHWEKIASAMNAQIKRAKIQQGDLAQLFA